MTTKITVIGLSLLLAACQGPVRTAKPGPFVKPGLVLVPVDQAHFYSVKPAPECDRELPVAPIDVRAVQTESPVSAIQFNRYVDPAAPDRLMHEAHVVYRRESGPRWKLQPASPEQQILIGPSLTDGRSELKPMVSQELEAYLRDQRANLQRQQHVLARVSESMRQLAEQQQRLAAELEKRQRRSSKPPIEGESSSDNNESAEASSQPKAE
jgi:hypothetical protein